MELPYHLKTLEPLKGALPILGYLYNITTEDADIDEICDALSLSDRAFNKAMRRLVTKGYVQTTGDMVYRLTDHGRSSAEALMKAGYTDGTDAAASVPTASTPQMRQIARRLVLAAPESLVAQQGNTVAIGIDGGMDGALSSPTDLVLRLSVINGDPFTPEERIVQLGNQPVQQTYQVTPEATTQCRIRVQVFQLGPNPDDIRVCGGLYLDAGVTGAANGSPVLTAYGADITVQVLE